MCEEFVMWRKGGGEGEEVWMGRVDKSLALLTFACLHAKLGQVSQNSCGRRPSSKMTERGWLGI
jgi:hypothetical protein